jgi:hypothetical protein
MAGHGAVIVELFGEEATWAPMNGRGLGVGGPPLPLPADGFAIALSAAARSDFGPVYNATLRSVPVVV